jgi:enoyl-CoA hydratase/carnithine racemase
LAESITAKDALRIGLINWVVELSELEEHTEKIIEQLGKNQFKAVLAAKYLLDQIHPIKRIEASRFERETQLNLIL